MHKTTVTLPDDVFAAWKSARLPLAEVIRRGLDGTGDTARHTAAETRLAMIETRLAQLETSATRSLLSPVAEDFGLIEPDDPEATGYDPDEWARQHEARERAKVDEYRARLLDAGKTVVTATDAVEVFHTGQSGARNRLHELAGYGHATPLGRHPGTGENMWVIHASDDPDPAATVQAAQASIRAGVMDERRRALLGRARRVPAEPCVVTTADAATAFDLGSNAARDRMHELVSYGYARQLDRPDDRTPYRWVVIEPESGDGQASTP